MDDFELERDLEDAGIDAFDFSLMDEDERREALEDAFLDPDMYMDADLSSSFQAWEQLQSAGLNLSDLDFLDEDERREKLASAGLDPDDYEDGSGYFFHSAPVSSTPVQPSPAPRTAPVNKEDASVPPESREVFRYLMVRFSASGKSYAYRTDDRTISAGSQVMVPVGDDNAPVLAQVISAGDYAAEVAPYPPEKTKTILRRATAEDLAAHKQPKPAEKPAAPSVSRSTQSPAPPPEKAHIKEEPRKEEDNGNEVKVLRSRSRLLVVIVILLAFIAAMLGSLVLYLMQNPEAAENAATLFGREKTESTVVPVPTKTPSPTRTPVPTPSPTPSPSTSSRTSSSAPYVGQYVTEATASRWEWQGEWYNFNGTGKKVVGYYYRTTEHAYSIKVDPQTNCIVEVGVTNFYTSAPSTHKTTTNTTDPYNAKDYAHPDDFYYDYYDDFWDYEDAEDYWEEYGDW